MKNYILVFILFSTIVSAQNLDSLFNHFVRAESSQLEIKIENSNEMQDGRKPSLLTTKNLIRYNYSRFSNQQQAVLESMLTRIPTHTSKVSPSGFFRIHYDTSGINKPAYSVDELAQILDDVYDFEVNQLGYISPPSDGTSGGDDKYDVYIRTNTNNWGVTHIENRIQNDTWTSYMEIDNDFSDKRVTGIDAVKITCAHEFHHAIQVGSYAFRPEDTYYHEITSTSMEEFMYDDVNDYYFEISNYLDNLNNSLSKSPQNGYDTTIWNLFLKKRFGIEIIKDIWILMREDRAMNAIARAIFAKGSTFKKEFEEFSNWLYFTGSRAQGDKYFEEASFYPELKPVNKFSFNDANYFKEMIYQTNPVSNNFITFIDSTTTPANEITVRITNSDYSSAIVGNTSIPVTFTFNKGTEDGEKIAKDYYGKVSVPSGESYIGNEFFMNGDFTSETVDPVDNDLAEFVFPQPYYPSKHPNLFFTTEYNGENAAKLYIFSLTMELLYSSELPLQENGKYPIVRWNGLTEDGERLSSGVYIYVVDSNDKLTKGKFAVLNE